MRYIYTLKKKKKKKEKNIRVNQLFTSPSRCLSYDLRGENVLVSLPVPLILSLSSSSTSPSRYLSSTPDAQSHTAARESSSFTAFHRLNATRAAVLSFAVAEVCGFVSANPRASFPRNPRRRRSFKCPFASFTFARPLAPCTPPCVNRTIPRIPRAALIAFRTRRAAAAKRDCIHRGRFEIRLAFRSPYSPIARDLIREVR